MNTLMVRIVITLLIVCGSAHSTTTQAKDLLIRNATIVSPELPAPATGLDVLIQHGRIYKIGKQLKSDRAQVIDASGLFVTPGLIDGHTHLGSVPGMSYEQEQNSPKIAETARAQIPRSYLFHGFTTVIDLHSDAHQIEQWNKQAIRPTAHFCGGAPLIDGYPMNFIPKPIRYQINPYFIVGDAPTPSDIDVTKHSPEAVIKRMKSNGAVCVKTHYESGFGARKNLPTPSIGLVTRLKQSAHSQGLKVILHANSEDAQRFGLEVGVDAFAHGLWTWNSTGQRELNQNIKGLLDAAIAKGISLQPTIQVLYGERDLHQPNYLEQHALNKVLPRQLIDWYKSGDGQTFRQQMSNIPYVKQLIAQSKWSDINTAPIARAMNGLSYWAEKQGSLIFGSDTPSDMTFANPPGLNGRIEMKHWRDAGISPKRLLAAATIDNAKFFNLEHEIGTVEEGKQADLLILSEDPTQSIDAFDSIKMLINNGTLIQRSELAADANASIN